MPQLVRTASVPILLSAVAAVAVSTQPAGAVPGQAPVSAVGSTVRAEPSRQLLGRVTGGGPTYLEASAHTAGTYAIEYDIEGTAFYSTYVDDIGLGYAGGGTGTYRTRSVTLSAGGHLVKIPGVEGSATASVYLVQIAGG